MKILALICLYLAFVSASQDLEAATENNVAKKDDTKKEDGKTSTLSSKRLDDVSKAPNAIDLTTAKPILSSRIPQARRTKKPNKALRHKGPSHKRPRHKIHKKPWTKKTESDKEDSYRKWAIRHGGSLKQKPHRCPKHKCRRKHGRRDIALLPDFGTSFNKH